MALNNEYSDFYYEYSEFYYNQKKLLKIAKHQANHTVS